MQEPDVIAPRSLACPRCSASVPPNDFHGSAELKCPRCQARLSGRIFPAFWETRAAIGSGDQSAMEGEAVCFFHPAKRAAVTCERCGRFVCALCTVEIGAEALCPSCLGGGLQNEKVAALITARFCWSDLAFLLGVGPLVLSIAVLPLLIFTGPAAIFAAIYGWKKPASLVRGRRHWKAVAGMVCGLGQVAIFGAFVLIIWKGRFGG